MISFIAPIMLFLLSIFSHGIVLVQKRADEEKRQIKTLLALYLSAKETSDGNAIIAKSLKDLNENEKLNKKKLNLLSPKRQIIRTFVCLFLSLGLIMADMLIKEKAWNLYNHWVSVSLILLSIGFLSSSMLILMQVGWEIIDTKRIMAEEETAEKVISEVTPQNPRRIRRVKQ